VDRAERIIAAATGCSQDEAAQLLEASGRSVKRAIVMQKLSVSREQAEQRLASRGGVLSRALAGLVEND
jgi:N-acetylmuramic acid 6-phosphate etherase